ncbi:MAG: CCA tRNA nucleotidyltransferase [Acidithiobacillus sp.]
METEHFSLTSTLEAQWGADKLHRLRQIGEIAAERNTNVYLVGGAVRDLFLQRPSPDLDIAVEGDVGDLVAALKTHMVGAQSRFHPQFGTAVLRDNEGFEWDLARCRLESYPAPAALPEVRPGDIHADLIRRDFSINAMALCLNPPQFGSLLDPYGGRLDLQRGVLRVLHPRSFVDDPTRILRGLRFATRFQFEWAPSTRHYLLEALQKNIFAQLSGARLWRELQYLLELTDLSAALQHLSDLQLWFLLRPVPADVDALREQVQRGQKGVLWLKDQFPDRSIAVANLMLMLLWSDVPQSEIQRRLTQWPVPDPHTLLKDLQCLKNIATTLAQALRPSQQARVWQGCSVAGILAAIAANPDNAALCNSGRLYLREQRQVSSPLSGHELQNLGLKPGPALGNVLVMLHDARLDGEITDKESAHQWLIKQGILPSTPA